MAEIGSLVDNKFEILTLVGQGGMSNVYLARDKNLNRQLAVKEVQKNAKDRNNEIVIQSAIAEANILKNLGHVGLAYIVDIIETQNEIYIIMEYVEGESLDAVLDEHGAQPQEMVIEWAKQLCVVLEYLHTRNPAIIYRDMKPANIRLKPDGNLKLIDFGIAREYKEQNLADTVSLGTKGYAAPEQFGGKGQTDARTDVYNLGVTLYHLVTGQNPAEPPYELYPIRHWNPSLSGGLERIIQKCTQLNPNDRYQSCAELLYAINNYEEIDDAYRNKQRNKLKGFISALAACLLFIAIGIVGLGMNTHVNAQDYENHIALARELRGDAGVNHSITAIRIDGSRTEAFDALIDIFRDDHIFSQDEAAQWSYAYAMREALEDAEGFDDLMYRKGLLILGYSDIGMDGTTDNEFLRWSNSAPWFGRVSSDSGHYLAAQTYYRINETLSALRTRSVEVDVNFNELFETLETAMDKAEESDDNIVMFHIYRRVILFIENNSIGFRDDGRQEQEIQALFDRARIGLFGDPERNVSANVSIARFGELMMPVLEEVESRVDHAQRAIDLAFRSN